MDECKSLVLGAVFGYSVMDVFAGVVVSLLMLKAGAYARSHFRSI